MIYFFMADGFEEIEAISPIDILRRAGANVKTVGVTGKTVASTRGVRMLTDIEPRDMDLTKAEMIVLPGGMPGTDHLKESEIVDSAIDFCKGNDVYIGAICAAPSILAAKGMLEGEKASCHPAVENIMHNAVVSKDNVSISGKIITSRGAGTALDFGFALCEALFGKEKADNIKKDICYDK